MAARKTAAPVRKPRAPASAQQIAAVRPPAHRIADLIGRELATMRGSMERINALLGLMK